MLAGVASRHGLVAEPLGAELEHVARGDSKSAVSRRFKAATEVAGRADRPGPLRARRRCGDDRRDHLRRVSCVAALVITTDGTKVPVGLWDGDTENGTVVKDLLADLVARGLRYEDGILVVIDGAKALAAGVKRVFGKRAVVQRCTLHKRRDVAGDLDPILARAVDRQVARAFNDTDWQRGRRVARGIAAQFEDKHPSAAASLREGLEDMFTVRRLGVPDRLARSMSCTKTPSSR
jgi:putative transposase